MNINNARFDVNVMKSTHFIQVFKSRKHKKSLNFCEKSADVSNVLAGILFFLNKTLVTKILITS